MSTPGMVFPLITLENEQKILPMALSAEQIYVLLYHINEPDALDRVFKVVFPEAPRHVDLLCMAFRRFTPSTLLYMYEGALGKFVAEMSEEVEFLRLAGFNPESDLRAVQATFRDSKAIFLQPCPPEGLADFFKPFVRSHMLKIFLGLFPGCTEFDFWQCSERVLVDWVFEAEERFARSSWKGLKKAQIAAKDLKWILLVAFLAPREKDVVLRQNARERRKLLSDVGFWRAVERYSQIVHKETASHWWPFSTSSSMEACDEWRQKHTPRFYNKFIRIQ